MSKKNFNIESLFDCDNYITEGIKYIGSKKKIIPYIIKTIRKNKKINSILDGFSGSTRVSQAFKNNGYRVISNDINIWSKIFSETYLLNRKKKKHYEIIINHLNDLKPQEGWLSISYGGEENNGESIQPDNKKKMWQRHNAEKADAIINEIHKNFSGIEKSVLLSSLILALDKVDNSLAHHCSYLKKWSDRSYNNMKLKVPNFILDDKNHEVYQKDIFDIIEERDIKYDLAYFDPPYGSDNNKMPSSRVRYFSYYHIWTSIILNDKPNVFGAANRREDTKGENRISVFEEFRKDGDKFLSQISIEDMLLKTKCSHILLSYNNHGRVPINNIIEFIKNNKWELEIKKIDYEKNIMSTMVSVKEWLRTDNDVKNKEYLLYITK